jgi:cyclic pyranopterin phosphate synthase
MVDVGEKYTTKRSATASGRIYIPAVAYELVTSTYLTSDTSDKFNDDISALDKAKAKAWRKGDTLTVARLAGIMGCKQTSNLIPLCHPLALSHVSVTLIPELPNGRSKLHSILCRATVSCEGKTGVEMEALTAVSVGLLTVWDMLKAVAGRDMEISEIKVTHKAGGRSGDFTRTFEE